MDAEDQGKKAVEPHGPYPTFREVVSDQDRPATSPHRVNVLDALDPPLTRLPANEREDVAVTLD